MKITFFDKDDVELPGVIMFLGVTGGVVSGNYPVFIPNTHNYFTVEAIIDTTTDCLFVLGVTEAY